MFSRIVYLATVLVCVPGFAYAQNRGPELPAGEGKDLAQAVCATACHDATALLMKRDGEPGWRRNVERMIVQKGAQITAQDLEILVRYLSTRLGPGTARMETTGVLPPGAVAAGATTAKTVQLPDGPGKELVSARCTLCHDLGRVVSFRRTTQEWEQMTRNMMGRGPQASAEEIQSAISYLTAHFRKQ